MTDGRHHAAAHPWTRRCAAVCRGFASAGAMALLCCGVAGCLAHTASAQEEQRSIAEYDLANDARANGRLREAIDHVQKSLKLNPDNADAAHLGALVLLGFCALDEKSPDCRLKEAEGLARKALGAAPEHRDAKNTLGVIL